MPRCTRCGEEMEAGSGLLFKLGLASVDGYECTECGTLLCSSCYNERAMEVGGAAHDRCPTCDGALVKR